MMALTATATRNKRKAICQILGMVSPALVMKMPNRPNVEYIVQIDPGSLEESFSSLVEEIRRERSSMDRVIVYCRTYDSCSMIYLDIKSCLGKEITEPVGSLDLARFLLVDMFSACTTAAVKDSFCTAHGTLRVVIATIAFGLGLNCPNVRRIIHWGPAGDIEQ